MLDVQKFLILIGNVKNVIFTTHECSVKEHTNLKENVSKILVSKGSFNFEGFQIIFILTNIILELIKSIGYQYNPDLQIDQTVDDVTSMEIIPNSNSPAKSKEESKPKPAFAAKCHICSRYLKTKASFQFDISNLATNGSRAV